MTRPRIKPISLLLTIALAVRLLTILYWRFDGLYGQDAYAYFQQGLLIAEKVPQGQPPPVDFFWPNGYPLLIALSSLLLGKTPLAAQMVVVLSGALLSPLVYVVSRDLGRDDGDPKSDADAGSANNPGGFVAGLVIAVAGQPLLSSVVIMADAPALFLASLAAWCVIRGTQNGSDAARCRSPLLWFLGAGSTLALSIISRWVYVVVVPALAGYTLLKIYRGRLAWQQSLSAVLSGLSILMPQIWLSLQRPAGLFHSHLLGWRVAHFFQRQFENPDGFHFYRWPNIVFYAQPAGHPAYIFPLLGLVGLWGLWRLWYTRHWAALILLLGWLLPGYLFLSGIPFQNFRFGLTYYFPLLILTGLGLNDLFARVDAVSNSRLPTKLLKALVGLSLAGMLVWDYPMLNNFLTAQNQSKLIARQIEQTLPKEATLLAFGLTLTLQHYTHLETLELFYLDPASLETLMVASPSPFYLILDPQNIETQWRGRPPEQNYHWLQTHTTLEKMQAFPPYVLFKADRSAF